MRSTAVNRVIETALKAAKSAGAKLIDVEIPNLDEHLAETPFYLAHSRYEVNKFLASRPTMPTNSLEKIHVAGKFDPTLDHLINVFGGPEKPEDDPDYYRKLATRGRFQRLVVGILAENQLAGIVFPSVQVLPPTKKDVREGKAQMYDVPYQHCDRRPNGDAFDLSSSRVQREWTARRHGIRVAPVSRAVPFPIGLRVRTGDKAS
jgi:amidase